MTAQQYLDQINEVEYAGCRVSQSRALALTEKALDKYPEDLELNRMWNWLQENLSEIDCGA